uniref:Microtubule-associated protein 70-2-like n=1 Tax=Nelumbo nucifera TaxID=4432 RepID=A0A822XZB4_NELNU|nr:TPA_asm: hypothetical protein HUJ06_026836 [Nelumbo nucifera]
MRKKAALAAQFAAEEARLGRVHAAQEDDDMPPIEAIITPLEAELKLAKLEMRKNNKDMFNLCMYLKLGFDLSGCKATVRLTKSKEAALLEAERTVQIALAKASLLMNQIEICQEENKILDKMHRQKVAEVEKLSQTAHELEEAVLAGGAAANAVRDYQRKVQEMNVYANDKVTPMKQWLEERRKNINCDSKFLKKDRDTPLVTSVNGRTTLEGRSISNGTSRRQSLGRAENLSRPSSNGFSSRWSSNSQLGSVASSSAYLCINIVGM